MMINDGLAGDADLVIAAVEALGEIGVRATDAAPDIVALLGAPSALIRRAADDALMKLGATAIPALINGLKRAKPDVRSGSAVRLGELKSAAAIPALGRALRDPDPSVRAVARRALAKIDAPQARALLDKVRPSERAHRDC
jgi:HEAT repeat protein